MIEKVLIYDYVYAYIFMRGEDVYYIVYVCMRWMYSYIWLCISSSSSASSFIIILAHVMSFHPFFLFVMKAHPSYSMQRLSFFVLNTGMYLNCTRWTLNEGRISTKWPNNSTETKKSQKIPKDKLNCRCFALCYLRGLSILTVQFWTSESICLPLDPVAISIASTFVFAFRFFKTLKKVLYFFRALRIVRYQ